MLEGWEVGKCALSDSDNPVGKIRQAGGKEQWLYPPKQAR